MHCQAWYCWDLTEARLTSSCILIQGYTPLYQVIIHLAKSSQLPVIILLRLYFCLSPGFLPLWLLHERDISPGSLSQQRRYTPRYLQRYARAVLISNEYVRIQTQTACKPQLEQRSSPVLNILALVRETKGYKYFVVISFQLNDQGTSGTSATFSRSFTSLDPARLPYHRAAEDLLPGLEFEAQPKVRSAHEGAISSTPESLPALLPKPTRSGDAELVQAPYSLPAQPGIHALVCPPDRGYGRNFPRRLCCSQAPCRGPTRWSLAFSLHSEPDILLLSLIGRLLTHVH